MSTASMIISIIWTILHSFLHGFHLSSLNGVQDAVTCSISDPTDLQSSWGLKGCINLTVCPPSYEDFSALIKSCVLGVGFPVRDRYDDLHDRGFIRFLWR